MTSAVWLTDNTAGGIVLMNMLVIEDPHEGGKLK